MKKTICGTLLALALLNGCAKETVPNNTASPQAAVQETIATETPKIEAPSAKVEFSADEKVQAEKIVAGWKDGQFDRDQSRDLGNARAFLYLAANSEQADQKAEAFRVIRDLYADYESDKVVLIDDDYRNVVLADLNNPDKVVQKYAIGAAYHVCRSKTLHPETVDALSDIAIGGGEKGVGTRWRAVLSLGQVPSENRMKHLDIYKVYSHLYTDEGPVAAAAIDTTLGPFADDEPLRTDVLGSMKKLMEHQEPLVRGRALDKYSSINRKDQAAVIAQARKMLKDGHPFVVAEALRILGETKDESLIPEIAKFFDDTRENEIHLKFEDADGKSTQINDGGLTGKSVADAATRALDKVTDGRPDKGYKAEKVGFGKEAPAKIQQNVAAAREWVSKNGR